MQLRAGGDALSAHCGLRVGGRADPAGPPRRSLGHGRALAPPQHTRLQHPGAGLGLVCHGECTAGRARCAAAGPAPRRAHRLHPGPAAQRHHAAGADAGRAPPHPGLGRGPAAGRDGQRHRARGWRLARGRAARQAPHAGRAAGALSARQPQRARHRLTGVDAGEDRVPDAAAAVHPRRAARRQGAAPEARCTRQRQQPVAEQLRPVLGLDRRDVQPSRRPAGVPIAVSAAPAARCRARPTPAPALAGCPGCAPAGTGRRSAALRGCRRRAAERRRSATAGSAR